MNVIVKHIREEWVGGGKPPKCIVYSTTIVDGNDLSECFKKAYPYERELRYCSGRYILVYDANGKPLQDEYNEWKRTSVDIMMYYGGGVVD